MNPHMHSESPYPDYMQSRPADAATDHKLFLPDHSIEYHNPAAASTSSTSASSNHHVQHSPLARVTADASTSQASPFSRHLGRNRACASCRDRKLKCDGQRPICGQCSRAWATRKRSLKAKGVDEQDLRELEQPCQYLDVQQRAEKGKASKGTARAKAAASTATTDNSPMSEVVREKRRLELEVAELRARLHLQNGGQHGKGVLAGEMVQRHPNQDELSIAEILATTMRSGEGFPLSPSHQASLSPLGADHLHSLVGSLTGSARTTDGIEESKSYSHTIPQLEFQQHSKEPIDPLLLRQAAVDHFKQEEIPVVEHTLGKTTDGPSQLIQTSWPADFPTPMVAEHLCHIFFDDCHYLRCLFQPGRFFQQVAYGPSSPHFPSTALLHAIFAMSYSLRPDMDPERAREVQQGESSSLSNSETGMLLVKYHCEQVKRQLLNLDGRSGVQLFSLCKAAIILMNVQFGLGHMLEAWTTSGISIKLATALYLNRGREDTELVGHEAKVEYLSTVLLRPSSDWMEEEERRRVVFYAFASDRASAASVLWTSSTKEADLTTSLPMCSTREFHQERVDGTMNTGQTLHSADLFSHHLNDSFNLLLKGLLLVGRIGEFLARLPSAVSVQDVKTPDWFTLNDLVSTFSSTIPMQNADRSGNIDSNRLLTDLVIHTCALQLHEPLTRLDENSVNMCRAACTGIVNTLRFLNTSQVDVTPFSPIFAMTVGITGRVLVRLLDMARKSSYTSPDAFTPGFTPQNGSALNDYSHDYAQMAGLGGGIGSETEKMLQNEVDVIFIILCKYGRIWPLAMRQAKAIAGQLGVKVASPELLRYGLFTDRNAGNHIYR